MNENEEKTPDNCISCGTNRSELTEAPWGKSVNGKWGFIQCKPCRAAEVEKQIKEFQETEPDTEYEHDIICPHCGQKHEADGESSVFYSDGEHDFECDNCFNDFKVSTTVTFYYSTTKD